MLIIFYDGREMLARKIEFSTDGKNIIINDHFVRPIIKILRIVP